jgi:1-acyl-sn-glycerol-3-phosphate acyltransferase
MQNVVIEEPYEFIPPSYSNWWPALIQLYLSRYLRKVYGITSVECRDVQRLTKTLDQGHGVLLAPNHCRFSDPLVLGILSRKINRHVHTMASWHLFKQDRLIHFMARRMGAFSIYREGVDRQALSTAIDILANAQRPLVVFAEGAVSRHNDQLMPLMDGTAFIARQAARRRKKHGDAGGVMVHPIAIRYYFRGDVEATASRVMETIESHFSWYSQQDRPLLERIWQIGQALLSLKEIEYCSTAHTGDFYERVDALTEDTLTRLEKKWQLKELGDGIVARVKNLRTAIMPELIHNNISESERHEHWQDLATCYYLQQMSHYPRHYVRMSKKNISEHIIETVERFEEDFTDQTTVLGPWHVVIQVGEPIEASGRRERNASTDPIMSGIHNGLTEMLTQLATESTQM